MWSTSHRPPGGYDDQVGFGTVDADSALRFAGRLVKVNHHARLVRAKAIDAGFFGGGRSDVPAVPIPPRSRAVAAGAVRAGGPVLAGHRVVRLAAGDWGG